MAEFLTDAWLRDLEAAAQSATAPAEVDLVIQQVIPDRPEGTEVAYVVKVADGRISVHPGRADHPDVTFTQDRATAEAIHRGELSAQVAFMDGRLRLGGALPAVIDRAGRLAAIEDVLGAVRA